MFRLVDTEGFIAIEMAIVGYQFPHEQTDDWLLVALNVRQKESVFFHTDPALEVEDLRSIYEWFRCLQDHRLPQTASLYFVEPNLAFHLLADKGHTIRFSLELSHELKPPFNNNQFGCDDSEWNIVFELSAGDIENITNAFEKAINVYPARSLIEL